MPRPHLEGCNKQENKTTLVFLALPELSKHWRTPVIACNLSSSVVVFVSRSRAPVACGGGCFNVAVLLTYLAHELKGSWLCTELKRGNGWFAGLLKHRSPCCVVWQLPSVQWTWTRLVELSSRLWPLVSASSRRSRGQVWSWDDLNFCRLRMQVLTNCS